MRKVVCLGVLASVVGCVALQGCGSDDTSEFGNGDASAPDPSQPQEGTFSTSDADTPETEASDASLLDAPVPVCGNGSIEGADEDCDDGNTTPNDGCSATCKVEPDYVCNVPGQPCAKIGTCGDGMLKVGEDCDDANTTSDDGCSATCKVEQGWICPLLGAACRAASCGDGFVAGDEECDDKDTNDTNGCSNACRVKDGYKCPTPGVACLTTTCGDGAKEGTEQCEDGNVAPYDGCSPTCTKEPVCPKGGGACAGACGDGILFPGEDCDDGNTRDGDGCSSACKEEAGFTCDEVAEALPTTILQPIIYRDFSRGDKPNPAPTGCDVTNGCPHGHVDMNPLDGWKHAQTGIAGGLFTSGSVGTLDVDGKPQFKCTAGSDSACTTSATLFSDWYRDRPGTIPNADSPTRINWTIYDTLPLTKQTGASYKYANGAFFPIDGKGFTNQYTANDCGGDHNFHFTSELRFWFLYDAAAVATPPSFTFSGDDDVFVFINGKLAIDLGGIHQELTQTLTLNATNAGLLGLQQGKVYEFALFQAERNRCESHYTATFTGFARAKSVCKPICGDGTKTKYEVCDDGKANNDTNVPPAPPAYGKCGSDCKARGPYCGDGTMQAPELCDDGVYNGGYGKCKADCSGPGPKCGDSTLNANYGELCDDGPNNDKNVPPAAPAYGKCGSDCRARPRCGDGVVQAPEQCDDGNLNNSDSCTTTCTNGGPK